MIIADLENSVFDYEGRDNVIILPITKFVRKDGNLAVVSEITKSVFEKYPILPKKWGYMISQNVPYPSYKTNSSYFIGIPNKKHYASAFDEELFKNGIWYLFEDAMVKQENVYYIIEDDFIEASSLSEVFKNLDNIVFLKRREGRS